MRFNPKKSRSLVLRVGKVVDRCQFTVGGTSKDGSLGKVFNSYPKTAESIRASMEELQQWLATVDKSGLPGKFKAWIYQHRILPHILWPTLV